MLLSNLQSDMAALATIGKASTLLAIAQADCKALASLTNSASPSINDIANAIDTVQSDLASLAATINGEWTSRIAAAAVNRVNGRRV